MKVIKDVLEQAFLKIKPKKFHRYPNKTSFIRKNFRIIATGDLVRFPVLSIFFR